MAAHARSAYRLVLWTAARRISLRGVPRSVECDVVWKLLRESDHLQPRIGQIPEMFQWDLLIQTGGDYKLAQGMHWSLLSFPHETFQSLANHLHGTTEIHSCPHHSNSEKIRSRSRPAREPQTNIQSSVSIQGAWTCRFSQTEHYLHTYL